MRVLHIISSISRQGGGPSRSSQGLVAGLCAAGVDVWLMTLCRGEEPWIKGVDKFINGGAVEDALVRVKPDLVHLHGIWQYELHRCAVICRRWGVPYVIAPRGMLEPWSLKTKWLKKRIARWLYQDCDLKKAAALHATAESEADQFGRLGFTNPVIVSPNGVNVPEGMGASTGTDDEERCANRRTLAEKVIDEWIEGVTAEAFAAALERVVEEKSASGEYRFRREGERDLAIEGARRFFIEFSKKIVELSDGRCVYFAPDSRARRRNADNAVSWAEYAFHAVSSSGRLLSGNTFRERLYNENKVKGLSYIESILKAEQCFYRLIDAHPENDAILFVGYDGNCGRLEVVTRLDRYGNAEANLGGVTVIAIRKGGKRSPPPNIRPLTEVVETVAKHQAAGFSPSTTGNRIPNNFGERKGAEHVAGNRGADNRCRRALFVSRMHPKKGVLELVEAWARVNPKGWQCELVYTLNGDEERAYEAAVKARIVALDLSYAGKDVDSAADFILTGPLDDKEKWSAYARADLFVLPTYSENFGIVVAEALWAGVPVVTTKGTPWRELLERRCGWWIDLPPKESLEAALREATSLSREALREMGACGRKLVEEKYTWKAVCDAMVEGYRRALGV